MRKQILCKISKQDITVMDVGLEVGVQSSKIHSVHKHTMIRGQSSEYFSSLYLVGQISEFATTQSLDECLPRWQFPSFPLQPVLQNFQCDLLRFPETVILDGIHKTACLVVEEEGTEFPVAGPNFLWYIKFQQFGKRWFLSLGSRPISRGRRWLRERQPLNWRLRFDFISIRWESGPLTCSGINV